MLKSKELKGAFPSVTPPGHCPLTALGILTVKTRGPRGPVYALLVKVTTSLYSFVTANTVIDPDCPSQADDIIDPS